MTNRAETGNRRRAKRLAALLLASTALAGLPAMLATTPALAQTVPVTSDLDDNSGGTFREAVDEANVNPVVNTINSELAFDSEINLGSPVTVATQTPLTVSGDNGFKLRNDAGGVLVMTGDVDLTIGEEVSIVYGGGSGFGIDISGNGNVLEFHGEMSAGIGTTGAGIYAFDADGGNTIRLFGDIHTNAGHGIMVDGLGHNIVTVGPDAVITTVEAGSYGIWAKGNDNVIELSGQIETSRTNASGILATGSRNKITVTATGQIETGTIEGTGAHGIYLQAGSDNEAIVEEGGLIRTWTNGSHGVYGDSGGNLIDVDGALETHGSAASGIVALEGDNRVFLRGNGTIETNGDEAHGIRISEDNSEVEVTGKIVTRGNNAYGIRAAGGGNTVRLDGEMTTHGASGIGIYTFNDGDEANTVELSGSIETHGSQAHGILAQGDHSKVTVAATGEITTNEERAYGIVASGDENEVTVLIGGKITTKGNHTPAILVQGDGNTVDMAGDITTEGEQSAGISLEGDDNEVTLSGTIASTGSFEGFGIYVDGADNEVTVAGGASIHSSGAGIILHGPGGNEVVVEAGSEIVNTSEDSAIVAYGDGNKITVAGAVLTDGNYAYGMNIGGSGSEVILAEAGLIHTKGDGAYGVDATGDGHDVEIHGTILTEGDEASGLVLSDDHTAQVSGIITTGGEEAHGILAHGDDSTVVLSGEVAASGLGADGIRFRTFGGGGRLELHSGFSLAAGAGGAKANGGGNTTLTLGGTDAGSFDLSEIGAPGGYAGFADFDKRGTSTWTLTGANTDENWTVREGTLLVDGDAGGMEVLSGATLGGMGSVGDTVIDAGGRLVGIQGQTLTLASLELDTGSVVDVRLGAPGTTALFDVTGDLTLDGMLNVENAGGFSPGLYRLFDYGGTLDDRGLDLGAVPAGIDVSDLEIQTSIANQVNLVNSTDAGDLLFWDGDAAGNGFNGSIDGGDGVWTLASTNWANTDGTVNGAMSLVPGFVIFAAAPGTVTVDDSDGAISVTGMQFATNGYVLTGDAIELAGLGGDAIVVVGDYSSASAGYTATIESELSGSAQLVKNDLGTLVLSGSNTYSGGTRINAGIVQVSQDANLGDAAGGLVMNGGTLATTASFDSARDVTLLADGRFDVAAGTALGLDGDIIGSGDLIKQGSGMLLLSGSNTYGDTIVEAGTLAGHSGSISGDIANAGTVIFAQATDGTFVGNIAGRGGTDGVMIKDGAGVLTLTGTSSLDWSIGAGSVVTAAERFTGDATLVTGGELVFDQASDASSAILLSGDGTGTFTKTGAGVLTLTGANGGYAGHTDIDGGTLMVADALGGTLDVNASGVLAGNGTVGTTTVRAGGTISPGEAGQLGTLNVDGDLTFEAGSTYIAHVDALDGSDLISVSGTATIEGGAVQIEKLSAETSYMDGQTYRLLTAGSLADDGEFTLNQPFLFLDAELIYGSTFVDLALTRSTSFTDTALTFNQFQTATAFDDLEQGGDALAVFNELLVMTDADQARRAFDLASGEAHAAVQHVIDQTFGLFSRTLRGQASAGLGGGLTAGRVFTAPLAYGPGAPNGPGVAAIDNATTAAYADERVAQAWLAPLGGRGAIDADGNAGQLDWWTLGLAGGYEGALEVSSGQAYAGFGLGYLRSHGAVDARLSSFDADGFHIGAYGGWKDGRWSLAGSLAYAANRISTTRRIVVGGIDRTAEADYWSHTIGFAGEAAYGFDLANGTTISPLFTLDAGWSGHDGFTETGAGALNLTGASESWTRLDTGIGFALQHVVLTETGRVTLDGRLLWEHAFADVVSSQTLAFAGSPTGFTVNGPDAGRDRLRLGLGLSFEVTEDLTIRGGYTGLFSGNQQSHGASAGINVKF